MINVPVRHNNEHGNDNEHFLTERTLLDTNRVKKLMMLKVLDASVLLMLKSNTFSNAWYFIFL